MYLMIGKVFVIGLAVIGLSGCLGPLLYGTVEVEGNTITASMTNRGSDTVFVLSEGCGYGFSFEIRDLEGERMRLHRGDLHRTDMGHCLDLPWIALEKGETVHTSWTWEDATEGEYEAWVAFMIYTESNGNISSSGITVVERFSI